MVTAYQDKDQLLGNLKTNASIGPFRVRDRMATDSRVVTIIGNVNTAGAGTITVEYYADAAATLGGSSADVMNTANFYILHKEVSPDLYIKLTMTGRDTDDIDIYML